MISAVVHQSHTTIASRAIDLIGRHDPNCDHLLELDRHAEQLRSAAPTLAAILKRDETVIRIQSEYAELNAKAQKARRQFEFTVMMLSLMGVAAALLSIFLVLVPPEIPALLRWGLSLLAALLVMVALSLTSARFEVGRRARWLQSKTGGALSWVAWLAVLAALTYLTHGFVVPDDLTEHAQTLQLLAVAALGLTLLGADAATGGTTRRLVYSLTRRLPWPSGAARISAIDSLSLHQRWYELRGRAEARRRSLFMAILDAAPPADVFDSGAPHAPSLLAQKLEYFRRYQIEVQQSYYREASERNKRRALWADRLRLAAFLAFVSMGTVFLITSLGSRAEQGSSFVGPDRWTAFLVRASMEGADDIAILLALAALGTYAVLQFRTLALRDRLNHARFGNALAALRQATSVEPEKADLRLLQYPLNHARLAAAENRPDGVRHLFSEVNRLLGAEVGDWNCMTPYAITIVGSAARLRSAEPLDAEKDFERIALHLEDFNCRLMRARKVSFVAAREATGPERIETRFEGKEAENTAQVGDWVVTNMDRERRIIRDSQGRENTYVVRKERFSELYVKDAGATEFGVVFKAVGNAVDVIHLAGGFDIVAPWGERQQAATGYLIRNGQDVYGIHAGAFDQTYEIVS